LTALVGTTLGTSTLTQLHDFSTMSPRLGPAIPPGPIARPIHPLTPRSLSSPELRTAIPPRLLWAPMAIVRARHDSRRSRTRQALAPADGRPSTDDQASRTNPPCSPQAEATNRATRLGEGPPYAAAGVLPPGQGPASQGNLPGSATQKRTDNCLLMDLIPPNGGW